MVNLKYMSAWSGERCESLHIKGTIGVAVDRFQA